MLTSKLACGPMSKEIIEAVFVYSDKLQQPMMLICSRNQIDKHYGYVFDTKEYMQYISKMKTRYPFADVMICRDHCGPNFGAKTETNLDGTKETIRCDLENGFDLIHIDLCLANDMSHKNKLYYTMELMRYAISIRSDVLFEIGTDENIGITEKNVPRIIQDIETCQSVANPRFYVVQTGSLVYGVRNAGSFIDDLVQEMSVAIHKCGTNLKEHNADYLTTDQLKQRRGIVDAVNIAPQLGVAQTSHVLSECLLYGIETDPFIYKVVYDYKWKKWTDDYRNHLLCATLAGHYHFSELEYLDLIRQLESKCDIHEQLIRLTIKVIDHYMLSLGDMQ